MDNLTKEKLTEIITALEIETVNIAGSLDLRKNDLDSYPKTRDLITIGSIILWLKNCLRNNESAEKIIEKTQLFDEVVHEQRYVTAGNISQIAYDANRIVQEQLDQVEIERLTTEIKDLDENSFYPIGKDDLAKSTRRISTEASKDAARIVRSLLADKDFTNKVTESGYRLDEEFIKPEHHLAKSLKEQITASQEISERLTKIGKQIKTRTR